MPSRLMWAVAAVALALALLLMLAAIFIDTGR